MEGGGDLLDSKIKKKIIINTPLTTPQKPVPEDDARGTMGWYMHSGSAKIEGLQGVPGFECKG